jgi:hypothetical protein
MPTRAGYVAGLLCLFSTAALAQQPLPEVEVELRAKPGPVQMTLAPVPSADTCAWTASPLPLRDASDPAWFATGPTARQDMTELHANAIVPLVNFAALGRALRLYVFGAPVGTTLRFSAAGWQPKWPFC